MTERDFCYWLQGFFELSETEQLSQKQILVIKQHLELAMTKVTKEPERGEKHNLSFFHDCQNHLTC